MKQHAAPSRPSSNTQQLQSGRPVLSPGAYEPGGFKDRRYVFYHALCFQGRYVYTYIYSLDFNVDLPLQVSEDKV